MSSLRRREIVVSRARSAERSSIGGRVSARAAAAESSGSASTRSQAIASRTSGRWKRAAGPERWNGMSRSSIAAATAPPRRAGSSIEHADLFRRRPAGEQVLGLSRNSLRLGALVAAAPEADRGLAEPACPARSRSASGWTARDHARRRGRRGEEVPGVALDTVRRHPRKRRSPAPARRGGSGCPVPELARIDRWAAVVSSSSSTIRCGEAIGERGANVGALVEEPVQGEEDVAAVEVAGLGEDAVVGGGQLRQLGLAGGSPALSASIRSSRRASRPAGLPRISWLRSGSSSMRSSRIASRSAAAEHVEERVEARRRRSARAAAARASRLPGADPELLVGAVQQGLDCARAGAARWPRSRSRTRTRSGATPSAARRARRRARTSVLPVPAAPSSSSGPPPWATARSCGFGQGEHRPTLACRRHRDPSSVDVFSADWLGICRRIVAAQRRVFARCAGIEARTVYEGVGEGGDRTLAIDRRCEDVVFAELEALAAEGASFVAVSEERGEVAFGSGGLARVVIDPIDGSLNARRTLPSHSLSIAVASGPSMADVEFGFVYDFGAGEEFVATRGGGATLNGEPIRVAADGGKLELVGIEAAEPELGAGGDRVAGRQGLPPARGRVDRDQRGLRRRRPLRRDAQPASLPLGRRRRRAADRPRGGRRRRLRRPRPRRGAAWASTPATRSPPPAASTALATALAAQAPMPPGLRCRMTAL